MAQVERTEVSAEKHGQLALGAGTGGINRGQWMALAAALLGWMFDGAEMGLFSMVGRSAIQDLLGITGKPSPDQEGQIGFLFGVVTAGFLVGAATGGVLFGWLGDRIGRVRAMTISVFTYAFFTGLCGLMSEAWQVAALRFVAALGMGGEWSLGVALVMEVWPNRSRALMAGLIGAAANVGYLMVGVIGLGLAHYLEKMGGWLSAVGLPEKIVTMLVAYRGWRLLMIIGTFPALLTFFIRLFVPESEKWQQEQETGGTSNWVTRDLLGVLVGALGPAIIIFVWIPPNMWQHAVTWGTPARLLASVVGLVIATVGYTYPVIRYLQRHSAGTGDAAHEWQRTVPRMLLAACLAAVALLGTWGSTQWAPTWASQLTDGAQQSREWTQIWSAVGAIVGTIAAALMGDWLGRRVTYLLLCVTSLASAILLFQGNREYGYLFLATMFLAGGCTASFYGWLPLYLPELFRTNVRATGQGFSFNFGRIIAAIGVLQTGTLMGLFKQDTHLFGVTLSGGYPLACSTMSLIYVLGMLLIWLSPETKGKPLPE